ncbi:MAG: hypothetical protein HeimC2_45600 [Candidatus Heimdallarchaeota archaeon LC_2]|nr:MAG: hypothetical protein HeimC2_45600 [Candidatus Heimdallarchaeota archaeon LC_2]
MPIISLRVSDKQKKDMENMKWINWSEIIRSTIEDLIPSLKHQDLAKAVIISDLLRQKKGNEPSMDALSILRTWRN